MGLLDQIFGNRQKNTAETAKSRLSVIVAQQRAARDQKIPDYLPQLQKDIMEVISKYVQIEEDDLKVQVEREEGYEVLGLNVTLPDTATAKQ